MPLSTDSGYLPDWLRALLGGGVLSSQAPVGLFSDTAASPAPNIGLLSNNPIFTGVRPDAPAFQGDNSPFGPLPPQPPTFSYMNPNNPAFQNGPPAVQGYPSLTMPQDTGPMNIGPQGAPAFTGVNPTAPFTANGPSAVQGSDIPLPPRRPADLRDFQATTAAPTSLVPPAPNSNVQGTPASGAPEAVMPAAQPKSPGFGDYLGKASDLIGSIYGAGGPGDALIALGLSNRTNGASIQALNAGILNRSRQAELALKQAEANDKIKAIAGNVALVTQALPEPFG